MRPKKNKELILIYVYMSYNVKNDLLIEEMVHAFIEPRRSMLP